jgi:hypothetical protein
MSPVLLFPFGAKKSASIAIAGAIANFSPRRPQTFASICAMTSFLKLLLPEKLIIRELLIPFNRLLDFVRSVDSVLSQPNKHLSNFSLASYSMLLVLATWSGIEVVGKVQRINDSDVLGSPQPLNEIKPCHERHRYNFQERGTAFAAVFYGLR